MLSAVYQLSTDHVGANFEKDAGNRLYWRAEPSSHDRRADPRLAAVRVRRARRQDGRSVDAADAVRSTGARSTERSAATSSTTTCSCSISRVPNLSAEQRFTTTVPLQRLFFMNSDFMQQQGELHRAARVAPSRDNTARIQKAYRLIFGRARDRRGGQGRARVPDERAAEGVRGAKRQQGRKGHEGHKGRHGHEGRPGRHEDGHLATRATTARKRARA